MMSHDVACPSYTVNSIALVKPERAKMVESMLIQMAQTGQLQGKVTVLSRDCRVTAPVPGTE